MTNYIAVIHKEKKSDVGVSFPDFPGCITVGKTVDEAREMAEEALAGRVAMIAEDGLALPPPTKLEQILKDKYFTSAAAYFIFSIAASKSKTFCFNVTLETDYSKRIT